MRRFIIPVIALAMMLFAVNHVVKARQSPPKLPPPIEPGRSPFTNTLAGSGIVEAETENISVGTHLGGIVTEVPIKVGQKVAKDAPLFSLDERALRAELKLRQSNLAAAESQLARLESMPRPEELPAAQAKVREAAATVENWSDQHERAKKLFASRAIGEEEVTRLGHVRGAAVAQFEKAQAELKLLEAGAWDAEKRITSANVEQMRAQIGITETEIQRLTMKAPMAGEVLQVNVRPGEFVGATAGQALVVLGNIDRLHVRVDIDENDIHRYTPGLPGKARLRGDPRQEFNLRFVRVEPFVIPKKSLTGANTERIDTRVLQVIYAVDSAAPRIYVGQQVDVYLDAGAK